MVGGGLWWSLLTVPANAPPNTATLCAAVRAAGVVLSSLFRFSLQSFRCRLSPLQWTAGDGR